MMNWKRRRRRRRMNMMMSNSRSSSRICCLPSLVHDGRRRYQFCVTLCAQAKAAICSLACQITNEGAFCQAILQLPRFPGYGVEQAHGRKAIVPLSTTKEVDEIIVTILKVQCFSCGYNSIQDTKRDPKGAMLDICMDIHKNTYRDHVVHILQLDRDEIEMLLASKHPRFRRRLPPSYFNEDHHHHRESRSVIFEMMRDLKEMKQDDLEDLWMEYGSKK
jgi:hypothetical protein